MVDIKSKIHGCILDFYESDTKNAGSFRYDADSDNDQEVRINSISPDDMKLEGLSDIVLKNFRRSIQLDIPVSPNFNSKFIIFHEMMRFLHDFLSTSLMIRRNYYESLVSKTNDLSEFYSSTVVKKKTLHSENYEITIEMLSIKSSIEKTEAQIQDKATTVTRRLEEINDHSIELRNLEKELAKVEAEKERKLKMIITAISQAASTEFEYV